MKRPNIVLFCFPFVMFLATLFLQGCATSHGTVPSTPPIPLREVNLEAVVEENEGLEVREEDAKELRDFYRGGVQLKAKGEKYYGEKSYPLAIRMFEASNDFFFTILQYIEEDSADYPLFEGTKILFFPNLLSADNNFKLGLIYQNLGTNPAAIRCWKRADSFIKKSLNSELTEWGLALQQEILARLSAPKN